MLTDPTSPRSSVRGGEEAVAQSLAIVDRGGQIIGGAFNDTMPSLDVDLEFRKDDPFLATVLTTHEPVITALGTQVAEALTALSNRYPKFREAHARGKGGHHLLVACSDALAKADAFELVAASAERYQALGYEFMAAETTDQRTGAAFEALRGTRVHFYPFQAKRTVRESAEPLEGITTSPNGYLSDKDSGGYSTCSVSPSARSGDLLGNG